MSTPALASTSPSISANSHFAERFGVPLPFELREQAAQLSWAGFVAIYGQTPGLLRLGEWACMDGETPARLRPQGCTYRATIAVGERITTCTAAAGGPVGALVTMLYEHGIAVEMLRFHQVERRGQTATFIYGSDGRRAAWAMAFAAEPAQSALAAVINCANRLLTLTG